VSDLPVLISAHDFFDLIFSHCLVEEMKQESGLVGTWQRAKVNSPQELRAFPLEDDRHDFA